jgi:hypothetical protein
MKKKDARIIAALTGVLMGVLYFPYVAGLITFWTYGALLVIGAPVFFLAAGFAMMAGEGEEDDPFIGY